MAIKAGLVGVNPKGVDKNGMPISSGGDNVSEAQLTANGKKFYFAYDSTTEKYGYKLDGTGDFIPFESAGGGPGWVAPASLSAEGLTTTRCNIVSGGYFVDDTYVYVDMIVQRASTSTASIAGFPAATQLGGTNATILCKKDIASDEEDIYVANANFSTTSTSDATTITIGGGTADGKYHIWGQYLKATA